MGKKLKSFEELSESFKTDASRAAEKKAGVKSKPDTNEEAVTDATENEKVEEKVETVTEKKSIPVNVEETDTEEVDESYEVDADDDDFPDDQDEVEGDEDTVEDVPDEDEEPDDEDVSVDEDSDEDDLVDEDDVEMEVQQITTILLPKRNCHVCRHLMPTMPNKLPKKLGGNGKDGYGGEFDCYTNDNCPARIMSLVFNPFTQDRIDEAVAEFNADGDTSSMQALYDEAKSISPDIHAELHYRMKQAMATS